MAYTAAVLRTLAIPPHLQPDRDALLPAAFGALAAALVLAREVSYGPGLHWDSIVYVSVAHALLDGDGFTYFLDRPYTIWPPLYPLLLAAPGLSGLDPLDAAGPLNAAAHGLAVLAVARYLLRRLASRPLALWGGLAAALALPLADMAALARPEAPFILFVTLALIRLDGHLADGRRASLWQAAALAALATLVRYPGIALLGPLLLLPALRRGPAPGERALRLAAAAAIAVVPAGLWMLRRYLITGEFGRTLLSRTLPVDYGALDILDGMLSGLGAWAFPDLPPAGERLATIPLAAAGLLALAAALGGSFARERRGGGEAHPAWRALRVHGVFAFSYLAMLAAATVMDLAWTDIQLRYLTPLYLPLLVAALAAADRLLALERARERRSAAAAGRAAARGSLPAALAVLSLWLAFEASAHAGEIRRANERPSRWETSEGLRYLRDASIGGAVHSNAAADVYVRTSRGRHRYLPATADELRLLVAEASAAPPEEAETAWVLWFHDVWAYRSPGWHASGPDYGAPTLRGLSGLCPVAEFEDGLLFRIDDACLPPQREAARALAASAPEARAAFDLHLGGGALTYVRTPCGEADVQARFFLHVTPADADDLSAGDRRKGFENLDFAFERRGAILDGTCLASIALPSYPIASVRTGQFTGGDRVWEAEFAVRP